MIKPCNRYILIQPVEEQTKQDKPKVLLPEDYVIKEKFKIYTVVDMSGDSNLIVSKNEKIIVDNSMVEELNVEGNKYYLVLENYILGIVK